MSMTQVLTSISDSMPRARRWTRAEYRRMTSLGLFDGQRVELIDGEIIEMAPQNDPHVTALTLVDYALRAVFRKGFIVRLQSPLDLGLKSIPEPDAMVIRGTPRTVIGAARTAELVVEVADSTLFYDQAVKPGLYASGGIQEYWLLNLVGQRLEVRRRPVRDPRARFTHRYADVAVLTPDDSIAPLAAPKSRIKVADLLP